jgi:hypothetical protein
VKEALQGNALEFVVGGLEFMGDRARVAHLPGDLHAQGAGVIYPVRFRIAAKEPVKLPLGFGKAFELGQGIGQPIQRGVHVLMARILGDKAIEAGSGLAVSALLQQITALGEKLERPLGRLAALDKVVELVERLRRARGRPLKEQRAPRNEHKRDERQRESVITEAGFHDVSFLTCFKGFTDATTRVRQTARHWPRRFGAWR